MELSLPKELDDLVFGEMREADLDVAFVLLRLKSECEAGLAFILGGVISSSPEIGKSRYGAPDDFGKIFQGGLVVRLGSRSGLGLSRGL